MEKIKLIFFICVAFTTEQAAGTLDATWWQRHTASISCSSPGYFVNPTDCRSFYRCVDKSTWNKPQLQRYDFTCPSGMIFDPAVSVCTQPGRNGCADPWWPAGSNRGSDNSNNGGNGFGSRPGSTNEGNLDSDFPAIFDRNRPSSGASRPSSSGSGSSGEGGNSGSGNDFEAGAGSDNSNGIDLNNLPDIFNRQPSGSRPAGGPGAGSGAGFDFGSGGDPLDAEFGATPSGKPGSSENIGTNNAESNSGGGSGGAGAWFENNRPPSSSENSGGSKPGFGQPSGGAGAGFEFGGGSARDPLDDEFGSSPGGNAGPPLSTSTGRPSTSTGATFDFGTGSNSGDPLDQEFNTPSRGNSGSGSLEDLGNNSSGDSSSSSESPTPGKCIPSLCGRGGSSSTERTRPPSSNNRNPNRGSWLTRPNTPTPWDRNDPNNLDFDSWGTNGLGQGTSRPNSNGNWGGSSRPTLDTTPWRPTGSPWGTSSNGIGSTTPSSNPPPPPPNVDSWWDPPYALPYQPVTPAPPPPPDPWANPFRPRYPVYQIVAYPTWPGPYNRNPIIVVYSNSKKK